MVDRDDIIRMAREAGLDPDLWNYTDAFERFAALVATAEREACAKVADSERYNTEMLLSMPAQSGAAFKIAEAIRARDKQ
jgi:hypothetical protein